MIKEAITLNEVNFESCRYVFMIRINKAMFPLLHARNLIIVKIFA